MFLCLGFGRLGDCKNVYNKLVSTNLFNINLNVAVGSKRKLYVKCSHNYHGVLKQTTYERDMKILDIAKIVMKLSRECVQELLVQVREFEYPEKPNTNVKLVDKDIFLW